MPYTTTEGKTQKKEHEVRMSGREVLVISGVLQLDSFDNEEFLLETVMGFLSVKGSGLQMINLDLDEGQVSLKGKIDDLLYLDQTGREPSKGLLGKLFR
ncbi:sporulation protein YabP [Jeotgalibacillus aurantiacus]|uniref:sporulation protein YabP n=1 Tax=Jeotgalibacillus aurantiacus TaxID=2763266 RepID=UPI001D0BD091|nr:sporulation protein YabP [Jeotgalibacillus aurantiacus]